MTQDKFIHLITGVAVAAVFMPFGWMAALTATLIAAVGKEVWDSHGHGTVDGYDALATMVGGLLLLVWLAALERVPALILGAL